MVLQWTPPICLYQKSHFTCINIIIFDSAPLTRTRQCHHLRLYVMPHRVDVHVQRVEECRLAKEAITEMTTIVSAECAMEARALAKRKDEFVHGPHSNRGDTCETTTIEELYDLMSELKDSHLSRELSLQYQVETVSAGHTHHSIVQ
jgi:hypothetical protein